MGRSRTSDVLIAGGGIIGLSIGMELLSHGLSVTVLERGEAMRAASWAAGGMLAAHDPENPPALLPLSIHSLEHYPAYLERITAASGQPVPLRTQWTLQQVRSTSADLDLIAGDAAWEEVRQWIPGFTFGDLGHPIIRLEEQSLNPRDLCRALPEAFVAEGGTLREKTTVLDVETSAAGVVVRTATERISAGIFVNCCGAWSGAPQLGGLPVEPVKGQMATVALASERLRCVLRTPEFYAIPRGDGHVTIGATIEHVGFDESVEEHRIERLLRAAASLVPEIDRAARLEIWAGLRPGTPDGLPVLGAAAMEHCWHATGHYRDGILLAPGTARLMTQAILGEPLDVPLDDFAPYRFRAVKSMPQERIAPVSACCVDANAAE